jgi:hypothetical protein
MEGEGETSFHLFSLSPQQILLKLSIFSFDLKVLFYHGYRPILMHFLPFPWPINYDRASWCNKSSTPSLPIWFWLKIYFPFLEIMASDMATSYGASSCTSEWRTTSKVISKFDIDVASSWWRSQTSKGVRSSWNWTPLNLVLLSDHISSNFCTLMILLQIDPTFSDELETIYEGCYEIENIYIFTWSSVPDIGHYRCCAVRFVDYLLIARRTT